MTIPNQISANQVAAIMIPTVVATEILAAPGVAAEYAQSDAWISIILSGCTGLWSFMVMLALYRLYPDLTPIQYLQEILGKWLGKIVGWYYVYLIFIYPITITDETMSFITLFSNPRTPRAVTILLFLSVCTAVVWAGIEAIARSAEVLVPVNILFVVFAALLLVGDMDLNFLKPVFSHGVAPVLRGAVVPSAWFGEFFTIGFLLPSLNNPRHAPKAGLIALGLSVFFMTVVTVQSTTIDGALTGKLNYAYYTAARYVSIGNFLERIDPLILALWVFGGFIKNGFLIWVLAQSIAQLLGYQGYRPILIPVVLLVFIGAFWAYPNAFEMRRFLIYSFPAIGLLHQNLVPTMLLLVAWLRRQRLETA